MDSDSLLATYLSTYFHADDSAVAVLSGLLNASHDISRAGLAFPTAVNYRIRGLGTDVPAGRITSYNVCYTKLLRWIMVFIWAPPGISSNRLEVART